MSPLIDTEGLAEIIETHTVVGRAPLVPEIKVHLATHITPLWEATDNFLMETDMPPPFWACTWPGGQALARYLLDRPETVAGMRILDFGCGNSIQAIAALQAGAKSVVANDIDPVALIASDLNAALNGVHLETEVANLVGITDHDWELVLAGDVCYERDSSNEIVSWLRALARSGVPVLMADPGRTFAPTDGFEELEAYEVPVEKALEDKTIMETGVWKLTG